MITKAIIKSLPKNDSNKYIVEIPLFVSAGMPKDTNLSASTMEATLCYQPGIINAFNVGDVVFISFEDNQQAKPVIIGKLFLSDDIDKSRGFLNVDSLEVNNDFILKNDSYVGDITKESLVNYNIQIASIGSSVLTSITGYDASKTQTLKNINGVFQWVDDV